MLSLAQCLLLLIAVAFLSWRAVLLYMTPKPLKGIPYNTAKPFGDIPALIKVVKEHGSPIPFFDSHYKRHGPIFQVLLPKPMLLVYDPETINDICCHRTGANKDFERDDMTKLVLSNWFDNGLIVLNTDDKFRAHRRALAPAISSTSLANFLPNATASAIQLVELWRIKKKMFGDVPFSARTDIFSAFNDTVGLAVFGSTFENLDCVRDHFVSSPKPALNSRGSYDDVHPPTLPVLLSALDYLSNQTGAAFGSPFPRLYMFLQRVRPRWNRSKALIRHTLRSRLETARARMAMIDKDDAGEMERATNILEMLVQAEAASGLKLETEDLIDELNVMIVGGSETSAGTTMWFLKKLAREPEVQRKLRAYLKEHLPPSSETGGFSFTDLTSERVPYLEAVVYELLRFAPATGGPVRDALRDTQILGHFIPKGTKVICTNTATAAEEEPDYPYDVEQARKARGCGYWARGTVGDFQPERWLREDGTFDVKAGPLALFGLGVRACWGRAMAISQLKAYLIILNLNFFFDAVPAELNGQTAHMRPIVVPDDVFIRPRRWDEL